jgi:hypothetical protein
MDTASVMTWVRANWYVTLVVVLWIVANVAPRPHPETMTGFQKVLWTVVDRLCVLTADVVPGKLKWIFAPSPSPAALPAVLTTDAAPEEKKDEGKS